MNGQFDFLNSYAQFPSSLLFVNGPSSSGKTWTLKRWFNSLNYKSSFSNCLERYAQELLFEDILNQLSGTMVNAQNGFKIYSRCESRHDFVVELKDLLDPSSKPSSNPSTFIILDLVDKLEPDLLNFFIKLPETIHNLYIIMISKVSWNDLLSFGNSLVNPIILEFPSYSREEILDILELDCPLDQELEFYRTFVKIVYETVYRPCRNLVEIKSLAKSLFPKFIEPVNKGIARPDEISKLVSNVSYYLKEIGHSLLLGSQIKDSNGLELPYYTKFLLISSFLASFNPPKLDVRFFSREKEARGILKRGKKEKTRQQLLGPRIFPLSRMLAIFYSIVDEPLQDSTIISQQVY